MTAAGVAAAAARGAQEVAAAGEAEAVTLFRGQALVTRRIPLEAPEGAVELTVKNLPPACTGTTSSWARRPFPWSRAARR